MTILRLAAIILILCSFAGTAAAKPALWKIAEGDTTIYIFGASQMLEPDTHWFDDELEQLVTSSDAIYFPTEQTPPQNAMALLQKYAGQQPGHSLSDDLPKKTADALVANLVALGMPPDQVQQLKPWFAARTVANAGFFKLGANPNNGVNATIGKLAQARGIPLKGFGKTEKQLAAMAGMSREATTIFVEEALDGTKRSADTLKKMTTGWMDGDLEALTPLYHKFTEGSEELANVLYLDENRKLSKDIPALVGQPGSYFVVVGVGNVTGENNLIDLMTKNGVEVSRVQ